LNQGGSHHNCRDFERHQEFKVVMAEVKVDLNLYKVLLTQGVEAAIQFSELRAIETMKLRQVAITTQLREHIATNAVSEVRKMTCDIRKAHLSEPLVKLFEAESKKEAVKIIDNELILEQDEFVNLITNATLYGYVHGGPTKWSRILLVNEDP
jgi:hypothetical protein